jgi:hypothetical protein
MDRAAIQACRIRLKAGETGLRISQACAEALGWRVSHDDWWNWHPGPVYDPPGGPWCIRRDGRKDTPCNEALPEFTLALFDEEVAKLKETTR